MIQRGYYILAVEASKKLVKTGGERFAVSFHLLFTLLNYGVYSGRNIATNFLFEQGLHPEYDLWH